MNDGLLCRCSAKSRRSGIRHGIYPGETGFGLFSKRLLFFLFLSFFYAFQKSATPIQTTRIVCSTTESQSLHPLIS
jgi:hypothetical protein